MFSETWAMSENYLVELLQCEKGIRNIAPSFSQFKAELKSEAGICYIPIVGPITRDPNSFFDYFKIPYTSSKQTVEQISAAVNNPSAEQICLIVDSPGGTIDAADDIAEAVYQAKNIKPIVAHAEGLMASAAYWISSQANHISANKTATIGSIGVYSVMPDSSKMFENLGITINVLRSHELKGIGVSGSKISDAQLASLQVNIDRAASMFVEAVSRGRNLGMEQVKELATGQIWFAADALTHHLIDSITNSTPTTNKGLGMSQEASLPSDLQKKYSEIEERINLLQKENNLLKSSLEATHKQQRQALIIKAQEQGKITPPMLEAIQSYADACGDNLEKLQNFIATLPQQTRPQPIGTEGRASQEAEVVTHEDKQAAQIFGLTPAQVNKFSNWNTVSTSGVVGLTNGKTLQLQEVT